MTDKRNLVFAEVKMRHTESNTNTMTYFVNSELSEKINNTY